MSTAPVQIPSSSHIEIPARGHGTAIALMCGAVTVFAALDASAKYLSDTLQVPVLQVIWMRFVFNALLCIAILAAIRGKSAFISSKPRHQIVRSILLAITTAFNFAAVKYLRLDQTVTIFFLAPLLVAALAGPLLGEWVGWRRLLAILAGFVGVIFVTRPGFGGIHWAVLFSFGATLTYALYGIHTRYMAGHDSAEVNLFYSAIAGAVLGAPFGIAVWEWPQDTLTWALFFFAGLTGLLGHWLLVLSYKHAPAPVVTPFVYVGLISMIALGYVFFDDIPDMWTLVGGAIVIGSGLYLYFRERALERSAARESGS